MNTSAEREVWTTLAGGSLEGTTKTKKEKNLKINNMNKDKTRRELLKALLRSETKLYDMEYNAGEPILANKINEIMDAEPTGMMSLYEFFGVPQGHEIGALAYAYSLQDGIESEIRKVEAKTFQGTVRVYPEAWLEANMNDQESAFERGKQEKIFERNPDTGVIRSREPGDHGNEVIESLQSNSDRYALWAGGVIIAENVSLSTARHHASRWRESGYDDVIIDRWNVNYDNYESKQYTQSEIILDELWAAPKVVHEGHWYVKLTDVVNIMHEESDESESEDIFIKGTGSNDDKMKHDLPF